MSVQEAEGKKKARLSQIHRFESECLVLLQKLSSKMHERCPLQHSVVLEFSYVSSEIANSPQSAVSELSYLLQYLVNKEVEVTRLR